MKGSADILQLSVLEFCGCAVQKAGSACAAKAAAFMRSMKVADDCVRLSLGTDWSDSLPYVLGHEPSLTQLLG